MKQEHGKFYEDILKNLDSDSLAIFAGAGLSKSAGYVDWKGLLRSIADDLGLSVDIETDLISVAQFNENKFGGRSVLNEKIIDEFTKDEDLTSNHKIVARLPIYTYWTTNYDDLIEKSLKQAKRIPDVKHAVSQLSISRPRRDAIVYKMHGDASLPNDAVLTKDDYERYFHDKAPFITALSGDLVAKMFLFIGFSFTDPNLDYILSRVRFFMKDKGARHHYYFIKKVIRSDADIRDDADFEYKKRKQELFIQDLKRFKLQPVYVETYPEITAILQEIESLYKRRTVFIGGSAEEYGSWDRLEAVGFVHKLSARLIKENFRIVNGFGWGIGSAVINGALEMIHSKPEKYGEDMLVVKPFPQFKTGDKELPDLWAEYRSNMLDYAGISIFLFGNKQGKEKNEIIKADGLVKEFEIAKAKGVFLLPVAATGYVSKDLFEKLMSENYYASYNHSNDLILKLANEKNPDEIINHILNILKQINQ